MNVRLCIAACLATLAGCSTFAQVPPGMPPPVRLSVNDVYFDSHEFKVGTQTWNGMCGYTIQGNYRSGEVPRPEWAINIDEVVEDGTPVVRVRAGAFEVVSRGRDAPRKPRPPITAISFMFKGERAPLAAPIVAGTDQADTVEARLAAGPGQKLLEAIYDTQPIFVSLSYADGARDALEVRSWSDHEIFWGPNGYLHQCLEHLRPVPAGVKVTDHSFAPPLPIYSEATVSRLR
jgi:hypothetical protein